MSTAPATPAPDRLKFTAKLSLGVGALLDNIGQHAIKQLALPIFNIALGVNPALVGMCLTIFRLWDAFTDPVMGAVSDNTRSRWGRRRPWIVAGAILCGLLFPLIWMVSPDWSEGQKVAYFLVFGLIYFTAYTVFTVPFHALAFEMTPDYDEKTRLMSYRTVFNGFGGIVTGWIYALTQLAIFSSTLQGVQITSIAVGLLLTIAGCVPGLFIQERYFKQAKAQKHVGFWENVRLIIWTRPFMLLTLMAMAILIGGNAINSLGFYLNVYYAHRGDTAAASIIQGWGATVFGILTFVTVPIMAWVSTHIGKVVTMAIALVCSILGSLSTYIWITPDNPWLQILPNLFTVPGIMGFWLMFSSMSADICDYDEWKTGMRREGMFSAVYAWVSKVGVSLSYGASGLVIVISGFRQELGSAQSMETIEWMRNAYAFAPVGLYALAGVLLLFYPLTKKRMAEIRLELEARRGVM